MGQNTNNNNNNKRIIIKIQDENNNNNKNEGNVHINKTHFYCLISVFSIQVLVDVVALIIIVTMSFRIVVAIAHDFFY